MSKKERDSSNRSNKSLYIHTYLFVASLFDLYIIIIIIVVVVVVVVVVAVAVAVVVVVAIVGCVFFETE